MFKCPYCNESYYKEGVTTTTLLYYLPVYKEGIDINPNRNKSTTTCHCLNCDKEFYICGNDVDGYEVIK